ncbi:Cytochrome P450 94A2 [Camellia lanceoleosa]|uniref:Cytochrome P450 94A2 n=1 Tax=Camellia lanceoleosa TaxID=1840588 RepID=A0ACC0IYG2_9ERIC|nr:Cytochrome P450 94A2 [Camellia lanceoleosa]
MMRIKITNDKTSDFDELCEMEYLHVAISKAMRLYPPVPVDTKLCQDDNISPDGTFVKKHWFETFNMKWITYEQNRGMEVVLNGDVREKRIDEAVGGCRRENERRRWLDVERGYQLDFLSAMARNGNSQRPTSTTLLP